MGPLRPHALPWSTANAYIWLILVALANITSAIACINAPIAAIYLLLYRSPRNPPLNCPLILNIVTIATALEAAVTDNPKVSIICGTRWRDTAPTVIRDSAWPKLRSQKDRVLIASQTVKPTRYLPESLLELVFSFSLTSSLSPSGKLRCQKQAG